MIALFDKTTGRMIEAHGHAEPGHLTAAYSKRAERDSADFEERELEQDEVMRIDKEQREVDAAPLIAREAILAQLAANDLKAIRPMLEDDTARVDAIKAEQAALRTRLR